MSTTARLGVGTLGTLILGTDTPESSDFLIGGFAQAQVHILAVGTNKFAQAQTSTLNRVIQYCHYVGSDGFPGPAATFRNAPTSGHLLIAYESARDNPTALSSTDSNWQALSNDVACTGDHGRWWYQTSDGSNSFSGGGRNQVTFYEVDIAGATFNPATDCVIYETTGAGPSTNLNLGSVTNPLTGQIILYGATYDTSFDGNVPATADTGWVIDWNANDVGDLSSGGADKHPHHLTMRWNLTTIPLTGNATIGNSEPYAGVILQFTNAIFVFGQALSTIKATENQFSQAQADILVTTNKAAQAQADINAVTNTFAQAQSDILATSNKFAQSQTDIKQAYNAFAQAQVRIYTPQFLRPIADITINDWEGVVI